MRLFIAINFNNETKEMFANAQDKLKQFTKGSFSHTDNIHLTLVFLGEVESERAPTIQQAMQSITVPQLDLTFTHLGSFPKKGGDVYWIGIQNNDKLKKLQKELVNALIEVDFTLEQRTYRPHVTLGRRIKILKDFDSNVILPQPFTTHTNSISLMHSHRVDGKLTYSEIFKVSTP